MLRALPPPSLDSSQGRRSFDAIPCYRGCPPHATANDRCGVVSTARPRGLVGLALPVIVAIAATGALVVPGSAMAAAPANDDVQNAEVITTEPNAGFWEASITGTTYGATAQTGEPHGADSLGSDRSTVWYSWTLSHGGSTAGIFLCATDQPLLGLYTKNVDPVPPFSNLTDHGAIGDGRAGLCTFDSGGYGFGFPETFGADPGQTYYIQVAGWSGSVGEFTLFLEEFPPPFDEPLPPDATPPPAAPLTTPAVKKKCKHKRSAAAEKKTKCKKKRKK